MTGYLPGLKRNGTECHARCPFHDDEGESLRVGETWRCLACGQHEEYGSDAAGFLQSILGCTAEEAQYRLANDLLPEPQPVDQQKLRRSLFFGLKQALNRPDDRIWVHDRYEVVHVARELVPERIHLGVIPKRSKEELGLLPARYCVLLPTNTDEARARMLALAERLHQAGHTVRWIDPRDRDENWTLLDAVHHEETHDQVMAWAKARMQSYPFQAPESLPDTEVAAPLPKTQPRPPTLAVVEGNTLRAPKVAEVDIDQLPCFSEFALAKRFADGLGSDWRYTSAWNLWAKWIGHRWEADERRRITWEVKNCCIAVLGENLADSTPAQRMKLTTLKTVNAVATLAGSDPRLATSAAEWDADPMLLGTPAGIIDLRTGQIVASERSQMISKSTSVTAQPGPHPWWDKVLERGHKDDAEVYGLIHRWCGYMLTGDTREERFLFIHGPGGGGKSKFIAPLSEIMGDYRRAAKMESFTARERTEHSEEIARLAGARLVTATETEEGSRWNESRITALTGRDMIAARHMHKSTFEYLPQFKLVFIGNHRPALRSVGEEMRRRIDLIEWGGTIPESDRIKDLPEKLRAEYPAILAWMLDGCLAWQKEGLGKPAAVEAATKDYLSSEDTFGVWLEECCIVAPEMTCKSGAAYLSFKRWAEQANEYVPSQKRFSQRLVDRGFQLRRTSAERQFLGVSLKQTF